MANAKAPPPSRNQLSMLLPITGSIAASAVRSEDPRIRTPGPPSKPLDKSANREAVLKNLEKSGLRRPAG